MRQLVILFLTFLLIAALWVAIYFKLVSNESARLSQKKMFTDGAYLLNAELEEELMFFIAKKLGIYKGEFEVLDIVNLNTSDIAGADYLLITFRDPKGDLCQVTVSRVQSPWAKWELDPQNFNVVELSSSKFGFSDFNLSQDTVDWFKKMGITADQVFEYFKADAERYVKGERLFIDQKTGQRKLPDDWFEVIKPQTQYKLFVDKEGGAVHFVPGMQDGSTEFGWKIDYPSGYIGPGYRAYLSGKAKGEN